MHAPPHAPPRLLLHAQPPHDAGRQEQHGREAGGPAHPRHEGRRRGIAHQVAEDRHAQQAAHLPRRVEHAGRNARARSRHRRQRDVGHGRHRQRGARGGQQHGQRQPAVGALDADRQQKQIAGGSDEQAQRHQPSRADPRDQPARRQVGRQQHHRHRQEGQPRARRRQPLLDLEEQAEDEDQPVVGEVDDDAGQGRHREGRRPEQRQGQHRRPAARFDVEESRGGRHEQQQAARHPRTRPSEPADLHQRHGQRGQRQDRRGLPRPVQTTRMPRRVGGDVFEGQPAAQHADGQVDGEDAAPAPMGDQQPAHHGPGRQRQAGDAAPPAQGAAAPQLVGKGALQQGQRVGHQQRGAYALHDARRHQHGETGGETASRRGQGEQPETAQKDPPRAEAVAQRAAGQQQRGEGQRIGVDHPLQAGDVGGELLPQGIQRHIDDAHVQQHDDEAERGRGQGAAR